VEGSSTPKIRSDRVVFKANTDYWDPSRVPQLQRIVFDNTLKQHEAVELIKTGEGRVDIVTELRPLDTLRVAQSPFANVVKNRGALMTMLGFFNMRKADSPWRDVRLRQAVNMAINRDHLIRYATKGNGVIIPALVPAQGFGHDPDLPPYAFDPDKVRQLLREAGYPDGLSLTLIASDDLSVQATVISKMLDRAGFKVDLELFDADAFNRQTFLSHLEQPPERQTWDIALGRWIDLLNFPMLMVYTQFALDGVYDWLMEEPALRQLYAQVLGTVDQEQQQGLIGQMERHTRDQAYFLFLYNPVQLYAVNKEVKFVPYVNRLELAELSVTDQHWSVRKQKATVSR
jgi:peptide/nickel transport system substrate-binding protein